MLQDIKRFPSSPGSGAQQADLTPIEPLLKSENQTSGPEPQSLDHDGPVQPHRPTGAGPNQGIDQHDDYDGEDTEDVAEDEGPPMKKQKVGGAGAVLDRAIDDEPVLALAAHNADSPGESYASE